jgi:hypothetical protein
MNQTELEAKARSLSANTAILRDEFAGFVGRIAECMTPGEDGKPRVIRAGLLESYRSFIDCFDLRNVADDQELAALVKRAKGFAQLNPESLALAGGKATRASALDTRAALAPVFADLKSWADDLTTAAPRRRVTFNVEA